MTKRKSSPFQGAWISPRLTKAAPIPSWLDEAAHDDFVQRNRNAEIAAWNSIARYIANKLGPIDAAPILGALRRAVEIWRFESMRYAADPEPAQWVSLLRDIVLPDSLLRDIDDPGSIRLRDISELRSAVHDLPAHVLAVLNTVLFQRAEIGTVALFNQMMKGDAANLDLLRTALSDMIAALSQVKGKRGPRLRSVVAVEHLRKVHAAIMKIPGARDVPARTLAADLLQMCGIDAPASRTQLALIFRK